MSNSPVVNFHFRVDWGGSSIGFSEVTGLKAKHEVIEYRTGADPKYSSTKIPGLRKFSNIVLKRGTLIGDNEGFEWFKDVGLSVEKRDIVISLLNHQHEPVIIWKVLNAWPVQIEFSELNSMESDILIESLVLAHDGLIVEHT